ncbi:hypothetical protein A9G13_01360 [Gilliamella sp. wkB178]|uniref:MFS transporter n=1 Tax=Gilliamella sp. wkB178 TaxID=3120259 RepID=UPI00080DADBE|nr:MFS transporter [Gilliamella apicola]OCG08736.1 hypothetical protein A9G13_01360 [Gilliamella apicola]
MSDQTTDAKTGYSIYIICGLGLFLSTLDTGIINLVLNSLAISFAVSLTFIGLSITLYLLFLIILLIPSGWFGDIYGQKAALILGFLLFAITSFLAGSSESAWQFILARCGQGIAAALLQANCLGLAGVQSTKQKLQLNAVIMLAISIGPILGPSLSGFILQYWQWRLLFFINVPFCILGLAVTLSLNKSPYNRHRAGALFVFELLLQSTIRYVAVGSFIFGFTAGVIFSVSPIILIRETNYPIDIIGLICMASPIGVILSVLIKKLLGKDVNQMILIYALPVMLLAFILFWGISLNISVGTYIVAALGYGIGGGLLQSSLIQIAMQQQPDKQSTIGGMLRLCQNLGIILGTEYALVVLETNKINDDLAQQAEMYQQLWGLTLMILICMFIYSFRYNQAIKNNQ